MSVCASIFRYPCRRASHSSDPLFPSGASTLESDEKSQSDLGTHSFPHIIRSSLEHLGSESKLPKTISSSFKRVQSESCKEEEVARSLESQLKDIAVQKVDVHAVVNFRDYLSPNERGSFDSLKTYLDGMPPGFIVSAGTERSFFDLALSNKSCSGLIVRDINPRVKAYVDFNVLLFRLSSDRKEYLHLSAQDCIDKNSKPSIDELCEEIRVKIERNVTIPKNFKDYYLAHLKDFAGVYFSTDKKWRDDSTVQFKDFTKVHYHEDDILWQRLKSFADKGNIVATIGSIDDLDSLKGCVISCLDISNIPKYKLLDLSRIQDKKVIWTSISQRVVTYSLGETNMMKPEEIDELKQLLKIYMESTGIDEKSLTTGIRKLIAINGIFDQKNKQVDPFFSKGLLDLLRNYKDNYLIKVRGKYYSLHPLQKDKIEIPKEMLKEFFCLDKVQDFAVELAHTYWKRFENDDRYHGKEALYFSYGGAIIDRSLEPNTMWKHQILRMVLESGNFREHIFFRRFLSELKFVRCSAIGKRIMLELAKSIAPVEEYYTV